MRISFVWQGINGRYGHWNDGLWAAMKIIEEKHLVEYFDVDEQSIKELEQFKPDIVLYWEAPCTILGKDADNYKRIQSLPYPKFLLFAGGEIKPQWVEGFDLLFVESRINEEECERMGIPWKRAFGVNTQIMRPETQPKVFDGVFQGTCASWKRHWLMADALGSKSAVCGRFQESDPMSFNRCRELGALVFPELSGEAVASLINGSHTVVNCSDVWGGGQRTTLEAMACGVPVIVMSDSPKNREYVEESGGGFVCEPDVSSIRKTVREYIVLGGDQGEKGLAYVQSRWTEKHYSDALIEGIKETLQ